MSGTKAGGQKTRETNKRKYGENFYQEIGHIGGSRKVPKGFALNIERAREAGRKGGQISRRTKSIKKEGVMDYEENTKSNWFARLTHRLGNNDNHSV